ncbi:MAG: nitroreductase family deazaflavin-dependent oxidoreductase [Chloroflexi bacterium]|nr:nitroreductase family deazaflavin-dependent oxidoreductase [Chloroflexota bacterium]
MNDPAPVKETTLNRLAKEEYCYLTTTGRVSGKPHEIEIWFGLDNHTIYLLSEGREKSDWVKNLVKTPKVKVRIAKKNFNGTARFVTDEQEEMKARRMLATKYEQWRVGRSFSHWARTALVVGIDLESLANKKG